MATYDLEQQEQLDQVKHFWKQYGNLITWVLVLALGAYAAWTGYLYWQQKRAIAATGLYEELDRAAASGNADRVLQIFSDLKGNYAGTALAEQGALMAAKVAADTKADQARAALQWLAENGKNTSLVGVARLRLAGMQMDAKQYDEALKTLDAGVSDEFKPLADDRRGDIYLAQGKKAEAAKAYKAAWDKLDATVDYRRFIEGKLTALGEAPAAPPQATKATTAATASSAP
ncbi:putative negative regulator of RcsB-dependent stress response [Aquabacterium commune]|uniref:Ancillary SecYEG translocon subunit n=1 Tax=Aquabacterium commune TaxID=70586 RepID=A0A4R6RFS0_9BURK|nr:tetratricopeptide repeat protein [Aquabacterium commune]TDP84637.1 putative negative regulator of RcsB-dependent stress response [Aquabacterium commune]